MKQAIREIADCFSLNASILENGTTESLSDSEVRHMCKSMNFLIKYLAQHGATSILEVKRKFEVLMRYQIVFPDSELDPMAQDLLRSIFHDIEQLARGR